MVKGTSGHSHGLGLACFALVVAMAGATQFKVGGDNGWSVPAANAESYNDWAEKTRFQIGDTLVFVYPKEKDSVLLVEPVDYNACNTSSYDKKFADGNTVVTLDRSGAFFFISGVDANCRANEKLIVMVLASRNGTATAPSQSPAVSSPPPASSSAPAPSTPTPTSPAPASPPPSSPSPPPASPPSSSPPASPPSPSSSGAAAPTTPPPASSSPPAPTPASPAPSVSSPPAPPSANAPSAQGASNPSATSPPPAANGAVHGAVASGLAGSAAAGIIGYAILAL